MERRTIIILPRSAPLAVGGGVLLVLALTFATAYGAAAPVVSTTTAAATSGGNQSSLSLTENTTTTLYVYGAISDADGCEDVASNGTVTGKFFRSNHANGDTCSADNNDCYAIANAQCTKTGCDGPEDTAFNYECTAQIQYYADSTTTGAHVGSDWTAKITATDASSATGSNTDTIEMSTTVAHTMASAIDYGTVDLDTESSQKTLTITNTGNSGIDIDISANGEMSCSQGTVSVGNVHYSETTGFEYVAGTAVTPSPVEYELSLANRTNDLTESTKNMYLKFRMPNPIVTALGGTCSNVLTITAKADAENGW